MVQTNFMYLLRAIIKVKHHCSENEQTNQSYNSIKTFIRIHKR